ncbi:DHA2 family efflux MFS transporter permease subunit [Agromyces seonyuensis]|uniref:DHA2 family efflux MFS transporter permease subunit n=1 Tax=Agromyces seonyuensis TaxID=2662446 RepID=A0A6I4P2U4_9MICO|nr:DHA2 family efflux MFS transporter permease subunit [Agromyces seonyuensis]MWB98439.1 DHA2 family efflux MFS transporter permease subunit [Agromyces seonyuensis]
MRNTARVLVVAILVSFVAFLDGAIINVAVPAISEELGGGLVLQQWAVDAYLLTLGAFILLAGSLSDTFGRKRMIDIGLLGFGVASVLCAVAPTGLFFVIARAIQGAAGALLVPASLALIIATFPKERQGRAIGTWTAWTTAAFLVGPLLGGALVDLGSWRYVFWINVLPIAVAFVLSRGLPAETRPDARARIDWAGAILGVVGLGGTVFALIEQGGAGWSSPLVLVPLVVGILALVAFLVRESRTPNPMLPLSLFRARNFAWGNLATFFIYAAFSLGPFAMTVFLQQWVGFSATLAGLATLPPKILLIALGSLSGRLADRFGPRIFMTLGPILVACGFALSATVTEPFDYWWPFFPASLLQGLGMAITVAPLTAAILGAVDPARAGVGSAVNNAVARVAGLIAIALIGVVTATIDLEGYRALASVAAGLLVVGGLVSFVGIRNRRSSATDDATGDAASGSGPGTDGLGLRGGSGADG